MALPEILAPLVERAPSAGMVTDFDGTLAPIVDDPDQARPLPAALDALAVLTRRLALVGVVSGRPAGFLAAALPVPGIALVGHYGLEWSEHGRDVLDPRVTGHAAALVAAVADAETRWPDLLIERKGEVAFALHWRRAPEREPDASAVRDLAERHGLSVQPARQAYELRVPVGLGKGDGIRRLTHGRALTALAFAGDDQGDVGAFDAMDGLEVDHRIRIAVDSEEVPSELLERADLVVDGPGAFVALLVELAEALSDPPSPGFGEHGVEPGAG